MTGPQGEYLHGHHASVLASHEWRTAENSAPHLLGLLRAGTSLLDVGCGPGTITVDLARRVAPGPVLAVDSSAAAVAIAAERATGIDNLEARVGDVAGLDVADDSFDVVHAHQLLQHLTDPVAALRELRRVCRPDGVVAVRDADYAAFAWAPTDPRLDRWLELYRDEARRLGGEPDAGRHLHRWALDAGFADVRSGADIWCFSTPEDRAWWARTWAQRIRESDLAARAIAGGRTDDAELAALADAFLAWADDPAAWFVVPHGQVLARP